RRSELVLVLVALGRAAVPAERTDVVLVAPASVQHRGGCAVLAGAARGRIFGPARGQGRRASRPGFHRAGRPLRGGGPPALGPVSAVCARWEWVQFGPFAFQPSFAPQYVIYFFFGLGVGAFGLERGLLAEDGMLVQRCWRWLAGAAAAFLLWIVPTALVVNGT